MIQEIITILIVAAAVFAAVYRIAKVFRQNKKIPAAKAPGCGTCPLAEAGCSSVKKS